MVIGHPLTAKGLLIDTLAMEVVRRIKSSMDLF